MLPMLTINLAYSFVILVMVTKSNHPYLIKLTVLSTNLMVSIDSHGLTSLYSLGPVALLGLSTTIHTP